MAAFAGGRLRGPLAASAIVVRAGGSLARFGAPGGVVRAEAGGGTWRLRGRTPRWSVLLEGEAAGPPHMLPVPVPARAQGRAALRAPPRGADAGGAAARAAGGAAGGVGVAGLEHGVPG